MSKEYADVGAPVMIAGLFVVLFVLTPEVVGGVDELLVRLYGVVAEVETRAYQLLLASGLGG